MALDVPKLAEAESLVRELRDDVGMFKIGLELYSAEGPRAVERVRELGGRVFFLDLKLHDIPDTVARASRVLTQLGASFFLHASGGSAMLPLGLQLVMLTGDNRRTAAAVEAEIEPAGKVAEQAKATGKLGKGSVARIARDRANQAGASPTITIRLAENDLTRARTLAAEKGLRYQTYLKMLLHQALNSEEKRAGRR